LTGSPGGPDDGAVPPSFPPAVRWPSPTAPTSTDDADHDDTEATDATDDTPTSLASTAGASRGGADAGEPTSPEDKTAERKDPGHEHGHHLDRGDRRRRRGRVAIVLLSVALVAALAGGGYLAVLSNQWSERSGEWEAQSRDLGQQVADLTTDLEGITSDLTSTRDQLTTAQQRITELADEKAQVGDDRETQRIIASDIQAVAEAAVDVSSKMGDCVTAQSTLLGYLAAPDSTTPEILQQATDDTNSICTTAVDSYTALQQDLSQP
jgi:outer membrane murein-binding lipoprotein Lpp